MLSQIHRALRRRRYEAAPTEDSELKSPTYPVKQKPDKKRVESFHFSATESSSKGDGGEARGLDTHWKQEEVKHSSPQNGCSSSSNTLLGESASI